MKKLILLFALLAVVVLAADFSGTWVGEADITVDGEKQAVPARIVLKQDGNAVAGTAGHDEADQTDIQNATVDGETVTFDIKPGEDAPLVHVILKIEGDAMKGTIKSVGQGAEVKGTVQLKREK